MANILKELQKIQRKLDEIGDKIRYEEWVFKEELKARIELNLTGPEAIEHYNRWMKGAGLGHLVIDQKSKD